MTTLTSSFIEFALKKKVLQFGDFTTKAGRQSPYFFNLGAFDDGDSLKTLGEFYANKILNSKIEFDLLYGPAYKGIPLVSSISIALSAQKINIPYAYNRKEIKGHGEGGKIVGSYLKGKVLIIDDVISAGTSVTESFDLIKSFGAVPVGVFIAIDRQEKGSNELSATQEVFEKYNIPVMPIIGLDDIIKYLQDEIKSQEILDKMQIYKDRYGVI
jgi:orotate phosphoribosyltransferase